MNAFEIVFIFFALQALLMAVLFIVNPKGNKKENFIFALLLFLFAYDLFFSVLYWSKFDMTLLATLNYTYLLPISLYGPLFFLYLRQLTTKKSVRAIDVFHFLPFFILILMYARFYVLPVKKKIEVLINGTHTDYIYSFGFEYLVIAGILFGYGIFIFFKFKQKYKGDPEMKLWIKIITGCFLAFTIAHVIFYTLTTLKTDIVGNRVDYFITMILVSLIGIVCYFAFIHPSIFHRGTPIEKLVPLVKYRKTGLTEEFSLEMKSKLEALMDTEKPFLDPEIRLDGVASLLDVSRNHASQIINEHFSMNFFEFINYYRIREAKHLLSSNTKNVSVIDAAFQSGFNNRISFYKAFKKFVGTTPSEYKLKQSA